MPRDPYEVLGVNRNADDETIKKSYRRLARQYHPDRNPGDKTAETKFKEVQEAYDILGDKQKRQQYDQFGFAGDGAGGFPGGGFAGGFSGGTGGFHGFSTGDIDPETLQEILGRFGMGGFATGGETAGGFAGGFAGAKRRSRATRPTPAAEAEVNVPFVTAALGGTLPLSINGTQVDVKVPAGIEEGGKLRLKGQAPGGGDLIVKVHIEPHPYFRREGNNVRLEAPLSVTEAILGTKLDVPTLDGTQVTVKVPPGTSSGARLRLRGKGINGGDQFIEIKVMVPKVDDERGRELMEEFAKLYPQHPRAGLGWS
jgi:DnaJ-class molecular chaperone